MKKNHSKNVKGMTLIEIIIAILVLAVMGTIMCKVAEATRAQMVEANHVERRTAIEAPMAAGQVKTGSYDAELKEADKNLKISGDFDTVNYKVDRYTTKTKGDSEGDLGKTNANADLYYYANIHTP